MIRKEGVWGEKGEIGVGRERKGEQRGRRKNRERKEIERHSVSCQGGKMDE